MEQKKYMVVYQEERDESWQFRIQLSTEDLEEARKEKNEMLECGNIEQCKILEVKEIQ